MAEFSEPVKSKLKASDLWGEIKKHKGWYFIAFLLWGVPPVIATIWPTLTDKKVPIWLAERGWPQLTTLVIGWVIIAFLIALVIIIRAYQSARQLAGAAEVKPFVLAVDGVFGWGHKELDDAWFFQVINTDKGEVGIPVHAALSLRLVNLKSVSTTIHAMSVEAKNESGEWVKLGLVKLDPHYPLYQTVGGGLKEGIRMDMETTTFDYLVTRPIPPDGSPIVGFSFFQVPENVKLEPGDPVRVSVIDSAETKMTEATSIGERLADTIQPGAHFSYKREWRDLTTLPRRFELFAADELEVDPVINELVNMDSSEASIVEKS